MTRRDSVHLHFVGVRYFQRSIKLGWVIPRLGQVHTYNRTPAIVLLCVSSAGNDGSRPSTSVETTIDFRRHLSVTIE
jgi:hypothetical protein